MKIKITGRNWSKKEDGILFLTQRMEEMLNHYTDHLYKAPVLNSYLLIKEYLEINILVEKELINKQHLEHILEEFIYTFKNDIIIKDNLSEEKIKYIIDSLNTFSNYDKVKLMNYLWVLLQKYIKWCEKCLSEISKKEKEKKKIDNALRSYISCLIGLGYSQEYIYHFLCTVFNTNNIEPEKALDMFINRFDFKLRKYTVYVAVNKEVLNFREILKKRIGANFDEDKYCMKLKHDEKIYTIVKFKVSALDDKNALKKVDNKLNLFFRYYNFFSHNQKKEIILNIGMIRNRKNECSFIKIKSDRFNYTKYFSDRILGVISENLISLLMKKKDFIYIDKSVRMHNLALKSVEPKNSFLNLWSILEILCINGKVDSKISEISKSILPILQKDYIEGVFLNLDEYLKKHLDDVYYKDLKEKLPGKRVVEKISCLIILDDYKDLRKEICDKLIEYPLIRSRIFQLNELYKNPKTMKKDLERFIKRIDWHLKRLYRTRNMIIHSGEEPMNLKVLSEHLHNYVDEILKEIMILLAVKNLGNIKNVFTNSKFIIDNIIKSLEVKKENFSKDEIIFLMKNIF